MRITKEKLKQIIKEEMDALDEPTQDSAEGDVEKVLLYIDKIDNKREYHQLLQKILLHDVDQKEAVMVKLLGSSIAKAILKLADSNSAEQ